MKKRIFFFAAMVAVVLSGCHYAEIETGPTLVRQYRVVNKIGNTIQLQTAITQIETGAVRDTVFQIAPDAACLVSTHTTHHGWDSYLKTGYSSPDFDGFLLSGSSYKSESSTLTIGEEQYSICNHTANGPYNKDNYRDPTFVNDTTTCVYFYLDSAFVASLGSQH